MSTVGLTAPGGTLWALVFVVIFYYFRSTAVLQPQCSFQSRTGCTFLTGQGVQEGAAPLCRNDFLIGIVG